MNRKMKQDRFGKVICTIACILMLLAVVSAVVLFVFYSIYGAESHHALYAFWAYMSATLWIVTGVNVCIGYAAKIERFIPTGHTKLGNYVGKKEGKHVLMIWIVCTFLVGMLLLLGAIKYSV